MVGIMDSFRIFAALILLSNNEININILLTNDSD